MELVLWLVDLLAGDVCLCCVATPPTATPTHPQPLTPPFPPSPFLLLPSHGFEVPDGDGRPRRGRGRHCRAVAGGAVHADDSQHVSEG